MSQTHHAEAAADAPLVIDVRGLSKSFGATKVVDGIDMQVREGEIYGFLGPNGSGKTTTIRMLCGLLTPDAGEGTCLGHDIVSESAKIKLKVGYIDAALQPLRRPLHPREPGLRRLHRTG